MRVRRIGFSVEVERGCFRDFSGFFGGIRSLEIVLRLRLIIGCCEKKSTGI
jgi:hypothetical protein